MTIEVRYGGVHTRPIVKPSEFAMLAHACSLSIAVITSFIAHSSSCVAQVVPSTPHPMFAFYGQTTQAERDEARAWSVAFWERVESGNPQTFTPQQAAWQSPLFNPLRSTRATLERLKVIEESDCDWEIIFATEGSPLWNKRQALKESMIGGKFETDPVINGEGFQSHLDAIFNAPAGTNVEAAMENGALVSTGLPLVTHAPMYSGPDQVGTAIVLTPEMTNFVQALTNDLPAAVQLMTGVTDAQQLITGEMSKTDQVEQLVHELQLQHGFPTLTTRYDLAFGVYGSLTVIQAKVGPVNIFIDPLNGRTTGSVPDGVELDFYGLQFYGLLSAHMNEGFDIDSFPRTFTTATGCKTKFASTWVPWAPSPADVLTPLPPVPAGPGMPALLPGRPQSLSCSFSAGTCTCSVTRKISVVPCPTGFKYPHPTFGCVVEEKTTCTFTTGPNGCVNPPFAPNWPGTAPAGGWPATTATCTTTYGYWN